MEHLIESRVILGVLCLIHLFINYAGAVGAYRKHINKKLLNSAFTVELFIVSAYVIFDNMQTPPHNGWVLAIAGYIIVYGLIFLTWAIHCIYALLEPNKVYEMTINSQVKAFNKDYLKGTVIEENHSIDVYLPYTTDLVYKDGTDKKQKVLFNEVLHGTHIIVKTA